MFAYFLSLPGISTPRGGGGGGGDGRKILWYALFSVVSPNILHYRQYLKKIAKLQHAYVSLKTLLLIDDRSFHKEHKLPGVKLDKTVNCVYWLVFRAGGRVLLSAK